jgi:tetratricopeptide (TPR) repeat protein
MHGAGCPIRVVRGQREMPGRPIFTGMFANPNRILRYVRLADRLEEAEAQFQEARRLRPEYRSPYYGLGLIRLQQGRDEEALAFFQDVLKWKPDYGPAAYGTGIVLARQGRYQEAIAQFQAMREYEFTPYDANTHNNLGAVFASQGRRDEAISHFREALRLQPDHGPARRNLARLLAMPAAEPRTEDPADLVIFDPSSY